jgi:sterol desaturase/sphingolipid hydroxylase (fatty acid hydroxylase superfamily)
MDMVGFTLLGSVIFTLTIGLSPKAVTPIILSLNFLSAFQHANIKTPRWLGYIIQRPEQYAIHYQKGVHWYNYSDLPFYDLLFGTFKNPTNFQEENGFLDGTSNRIKEMLLFKGISK